ncbi:glycosyltransferase [Leptospira gomenensis]|uniref:Glycosyltransferase n=1 Tax=Leptospira gomenensis TaxID=2484974 RepID=A0A5F1Y8N1_9LEPT|nr:glycosyltransferase [Leptospira gomenensis]TGK32565.1 glycosyltransferase [Leptospira gomenensis]TGK45426.1 glycosyltransferase [Leptospira gomenensis]TGK60650.1 glycosyltransferase [Leptospira gomenensis]
MSIITPSYQSSAVIEGCIRNVLEQGYENFEHVVIDGGSTDGTVDILKRYPHLKWISEPDKGQSDAMNKALRFVTGDYMLYLNADDRLLPGALSEVSPYLESDPDFVMGDVLVRMDGFVRRQTPSSTFRGMMFWWNFHSYCFNPVGYLYKPEVQRTVGGMNGDNHYDMDFEFLCSVALNFSILKVPVLMGTFEVSPGTKTYSVIELPPFERYEKIKRPSASKFYARLNLPERLFYRIGLVKSLAFDQMRFYMKRCLRNGFKPAAIFFLFLAFFISPFRMIDTAISVISSRKYIRRN